MDNISFEIKKFMVTYILNIPCQNKQFFWIIPHMTMKL